MRAAGQATHDRIMAAAKAEFTEHGLAGARLNRIAINANASKERLYSYFESKERLFEAVVAQWINDAPYQVPLSAEDVPGYVAGLFDNIIADPQGARLQRWIELEAPDGMFDNHLLRRIFQAKLDEVPGTAVQAHRPGVGPEESADAADQYRLFDGREWIQHRSNCR